MEKYYKKLFKNVGLLTLSNFGSKILSFLLVPLYTNYLSTAEYGIFDIYVTTITLLIPILSLNITEAVMRFAISSNKKKEVLNVGLKYGIISTLILTILIFINYTLNIIKILNYYPIIFIIYFSFNIFFDIITIYVKSIEKIKEFALASILNTFVQLILNVFFLVLLRTNIKGYFIANIISFIIPIIYLVIKLNLFKEINIKIEKKLEKEMLDYSKPLIFNSIGWWFNNVSDRYLITFLKGLEDNGIYSVSYKLPSLLNVIQSIFSQAWIVSVVDAYKEKKYEFINKTYKIYNLMLILVCSGLIIFTKPISKVLLSKEFYLAWQYAPFLMISVVFTSLSNFLGGIYSAAKRTKLLGKSTIYGAILNLLMNIILIKTIGTIGAAISTLLSYFIVWLYRFFNLKDIIKIKLETIDILSYIVIVLQAFVLLCMNNIIIIYLIEFTLYILLILVNIKEVKNIILKIVSVFLKK